ncbi:Laminin subunit alpha-4 [Acipenser ruthenus]|uniref:Laminin subunit alpha-4 n=1 Tax=Acipenser ruthenus TaxID=7906 RepID=A0A444U241_ACIRT|nr:Laminin subunit alpha-4 [Acipenser ruthenus]
MTPLALFAVSCEKKGSAVRCMCKEGYAGPICERCAPGYYGNPLLIGGTCKKCNCNGNSDPNLIFNDCHNTTGHCQNCWHKTTGVNCERCAPGYYGDAISAKSCRECSCDTCGAASCDDRTGRCYCKPGVTGPYCDRCEVGHYGFSSCHGCRRCMCGVATVNDICNPVTQACVCQPGAAGLRCERCKNGYWNYGPSGCQRGSCNSETGQCLSVPVIPPATNACDITCDKCIWDLIEDLRFSNESMKEIKANMVNISSGAAANNRLNHLNTTTQNLKENTTISEGLEVEKETQDTYRRADHLEKQLIIVSNSIQDIIGKVIYYSLQHDLSIEESTRRKEEAEGMVNTMRKLNVSLNEPIATEESMKANQRVNRGHPSQVIIKGRLPVAVLYINSICGLVLRRVLQLEKKLNSTTGLVSPIQHKLSELSSRLSDTRELLEGAVRTTQQAEEKHKENLVRFQENENCQNSTAGDYCEECLDGYARDTAEEGQLICKPCSCPFPVRSNNFAVSCEKKGSAVRCMCKEGYAGPICERCAPGYYGNPLLIGGTCKKCNCNGNSDPNLIFSDCHNTTGHCQNCWHKTTGVNCERCAPGYYGDAISAKSCRECICDTCGAASCDDRTGRCYCKPGVTGPYCDRCEVGHYGFSSCHGCRRCMCGVATVNDICNPVTQACVCQPGAAGLRCERCKNGYWNYGPSGCQRGSCNSETGQCLSVPVIPPATNACDITCDKCIWDLIEDLRFSNESMKEIKANMVNISSGAAANNRLNHLNTTTQNLKSQLSGWSSQSEHRLLQTDDVEDAVSNLQSDLNTLAEKENTTISEGLEVEKETQDTYRRADHLEKQLIVVSNSIQDIIGKVIYYSLQHDLSIEESTRRKEEAEGMVNTMRKLNVSLNEPIATEESMKANQRVNRGHPSQVIIKGRLPVAVLYINSICGLVLRRVLQLEKKLNSTTGLVSPIQHKLSELSSRLSDTRELLEGAVRTTQQAEEKHKENLVRFQENENLQQKLREDYGEANETLQVAGGIIIDTGLDVGELEIMIKNVSEFHAAIDGANKLLREREANLSRYDKDLVLRATDYAKELQKLAAELENYLKNIDANGFVQKAINASNVYENIAKYVEEANETAVITFNYTERAEDAVFGVNTQIGFLKERSEILLIEATKLLQSEEETDNESAVRAAKRNTNGAIAKVDSVKKQLSESSSQLKTIERGNTAQRLEYSKRIAENTLNNTATVLQTVTPINETAQGWARNLDNSEYDTSAYNRAVSAAEEAVENMTEMIPELLDKLRVVEQKKPMSNISSSILRIRQLIAQTKSLASKVQVSMRFDGQSAVEVHPKTKLEELKTFTSMSLFMKVDSEKHKGQDRFIMYLGNKNGRKDYMGLAIKNDNLVYVYNLGGGDVEIPLSSKSISTWPPQFNLIKTERLGRHGKVFLTVPSPGSTAEQKFIQKGEAPGTESLFDLDPDNTVFFVGGVPPDFRIPASLNLSPFIGCIELATLNKDVMSLYNFKNKYKIDTTASPPCPRYKLAFTQSRAANYFFDGTGYALVRNIEKREKFGKILTRFDLGVRSVMDDALLLLMVNGVSREAYFNGKSFVASSQKISPFQMFEGGFDFRTMQSAGLLFYYTEGSDELAISLENGTVVLNTKGTKVRSEKNHYNDGQTHFLVASVTPQRYQLIVDDKDRQSKSRQGNTQQQASAPSKFYFGGSPSGQYLNFTGCISNAFLSRPDRDMEVEDFQRYTEKVQALLHGCPMEKPPAALYAKPDRNSSKPKRGRARKMGRDKLRTPEVLDSLKDNPEELRGKEEAHCYLSARPRATQHAYQFGGTANSRLEYGSIPDFFKERSHFSLSLRTQSTHGLIFYVSNEEEDNFMALFLAHGRLVYMFNVGNHKLKIKSQEKYNDGSWHNVVFTREKNEGRLIIDGLRVLEDTVPEAGAPWHVSGVFYVGGVPPGKAHKNIQVNSVHSFTGCVKSFQLNGQWLSSVSHTFGVTPCFNGPTESGTYFSAEGGYVVLDDSFNLGLKFELVFEVRPRASSGILLHVYTSGGEYLNMHINHGQAVLIDMEEGVVNEILQGPLRDVFDSKQLITDVSGSGNNCSARFEGSLNMDLNEITMNLVPFPRLHYLVSSLTPLYTLADVNVPSRRLDQMFSDAFSKDHQLIHADPKHSLYLACALIVRGDVQVSDLRRNIERLKPSLPFVSWNQEGWKTGLCSVPPVGHSHSLLALANNTCVKSTFIELKDRFMKLYKKKAHLHHYLHVDGMEQSCFSEAVSSLSSLIEEYNQLDATKGLLMTDAQRLNIAV